MSRNHVLGHHNAQALLGAWHQIVGASPWHQIVGAGWQNSGVPTRLYHGPYGGHRARGYQPNFGGFGPTYPALIGADDPDMGPPPEMMGPPMTPYPMAYMPPPPPEYYAPIAPRNAMVDYAGPSRADRVVLPMSSGTNILPNTSAQITARPQNVAFRPERLIIGGTPADWIVNDIKVGNRSQFSQSGDVPGEMFAATTIDSFVSFETVQTAMDFVVLVTFVGSSESGAPFVCGVLGTAAI